jgi:hypothetical protein
MRRLIALVIIGLVILIAITRLRKRQRSIHNNTNVSVKDSSNERIDNSAAVLIPLPVLLITVYQDSVPEY